MVDLRAESSQGWGVPERKGTSYQAALYPFPWPSNGMVLNYAHPFPQVMFKCYLKERIPETSGGLGMWQCEFLPHFLHSYPCGLGRLIPHL